MMMMLNVTPFGFDFFAKDVPAIYFLREEMVRDRRQK